MRSKNYGLFRRVQGQEIWSETIADFQRAVDRMRGRAWSHVGEHFLFDEEIIPDCRCNRAKPRDVYTPGFKSTSPPHTPKKRQT